MTSITFPQSLTSAPYTKQPQTLDYSEIQFQLTEQNKGANAKNKRAVYEPSGTQRCRQVICSKEMALTVGVLLGLYRIATSNLA
ncbi:Hypothetical predicted protein [Octopus vulgaris]|uniref:Uncharacterized protein n=1 Tax=Octopus vulgaris TaxID=6645 RepID=A0AA36B525_OCTVU|nr:Hypothetical predicted protein [Octopus vulgaris]